MAEQQPDPVQPQLGGAEEPARSGRRARIGLVLGPVAAVATYLLAPVGEEGLTEGGRATAAVAVLMAVWWVAETLPLAVTSLLPIVLLPMTGALEVGGDRRHGPQQQADPRATTRTRRFLGATELRLHGIRLLFRHGVPPARPVTGGWAGGVPHGAPGGGRAPADTTGAVHSP
ncbi:MAG: hypothetical protein R6U94_05225 [Nitriliruptoraceae bacterium]